MSVSPCLQVMAQAVARAMAHTVALDGDALDSPVSVDSLGGPAGGAGGRRPSEGNIGLSRSSSGALDSLVGWCRLTLSNPP
jgi:hypothetical protein